MGSIGSSKTYTSQDWAPAIKRWVIQNDTVSEADRKAIEAFISQSSPITNKLSRGLSMTETELDNLKVGAVFSEGKLASWSTRVGIAQSFARNNQSDSKPYKVVIRLDEGTDKAAKVGRLGGSKYDEGEVIMSSSASFEVTKIKLDKKNYSTVWVKRRKH